MQAGRKVISMTEEQQHRLACQLAGQFGRYEAYVHQSSIVLCWLPFLYGVLTLTVGNEIWPTNPIYRTAMDVPGAPPTWGVIFIALGLLSWWAVGKRHNFWQAMFFGWTAIIIASFMTAFLIECYRGDTSAGLPPAAVFGTLSVAYLNRSNLAWDTWRAHSGWLWWWERPEHPIARTLRKHRR